MKIEKTEVIDEEKRKQIREDIIKTEESRWGVTDYPVISRGEINIDRVTRQTFWGIVFMTYKQSYDTRHTLRIKINQKTR